MSLLTKFLGAYHRSGLRGSYRLTELLSKYFRSLHSVPIETPSGTLYADMRISSASAILANPASQSGEDVVMRRLVRPGNVVYDIGAHLGLYTLLLSEIIGERGKVFAFEPNPELLPSLRRTIKELPNAELLEMALSDQRGEVALFVPEDKSMASISNWTNGIAGNIHIVSCQTSTIDDLIASGRLKVPHFIKCDVEGAELAVFRGARKMLDCVDAPIILFEVNRLAAKSFQFDTSTYFDFLEELKSSKYTFFEVTPTGINELVSRNLEYANVVAVPVAKIELI